MSEAVQKVDEEGETSMDVQMGKVRSKDSYGSLCLSILLQSRRHGSEGAVCRSFVLDVGVYVEMSRRGSARGWEEQ